MELWDELLPQLGLVLNVLRLFMPNPAISAYEGAHGCKYDFLAHHIAPRGSFSDTLAWFPSPLKMPGSSKAEQVTATPSDLTTVLGSLNHSAHLCIYDRQQR